MAKRTIWYMNHLVQTTDRLEVAAESVTSAPPAAVWPLICDATRYPQWGPWSAAGYKEGAGSKGAARSKGAGGHTDAVGSGGAAGHTDAAGHVPGAVYWLRSARRAYGRHVTTVERVEEIDPGHRIVYTVLGGLPVRGYRGEVILTAVPGGTRISWAASWDKTLPGRLVWRGLRDFYPAMVASLATVAAASPEASPEHDSASA